MMIQIDRYHAAHPYRSLTRLLAAATLSLVLLIDSAGAGATSLVAAHLPGGTVTVAVSRLHTNPEIEVSRSVGLMEGATADVSSVPASGSTAAVTNSIGLAVAAGGSATLANGSATSADVSRSVGLMEGSAGTPTQSNLGSAPPKVSRSVGLMEGAPA